MNSPSRAFTNLPPLSLYIHIPWCIKKCPYCDFNSHTAGNDLPEDQYIEALIRDLNTELPKIWGRRLHSIFIGGGTPSLFSAASLDRLLSHIRSVLPGSSDMEITLEANPGTFEQEKFSDYRQLGINRLSIGIQSFNDQHLKALGRVHSGLEARRAIDTAISAGFENFNLDLMYGLPAQTTEMALADLKTAINCQPQHLSQYQLTIEPNTLFHSQIPTQLPGNDLIWEMQEQSQPILASHGFEQYEVSAYAQPKRHSRHNMNYWQFGDYLGIGAGAHGKLSDASDNRVYRYNKLKQPKAYMQHAGSEKAISQQQDISFAQMDFEFMLNALRLKGGFDKALYTQHTGQDIASIADKLALAENKGLIDLTADRIQPTEQGYLFLNDLQMLFLDED